MVEQHLSTWLDSEIADTRTIQAMRRHFDACSACRIRLNLYRQRQEEILKLRRHWPSVSEQEWEDVLKAYHNRQRKFRRQVVGTGLIVGTVLVIIILLIASRPDAMPNIYELP
jgi:predicted anti-sigma-YlaC factor YlaD